MPEMPDFSATYRAKPEKRRQRASRIVPIESKKYLKRKRGYTGYGNNKFPMATV